MRRLLSLSSLVAFIAVGPPASFSQPVTLAPQISISSSRGRLPNVDPLVDPDTFFLVGANQTKDLPLDIVSISLGGPIFLFGGCCMSGNSRATFTVVPSQVLVPGATIQPSTALSAWLATQPQEGASARFAQAVLRASTPASVIPADAGTFLAYVDGIVRQPLLVRSRTLIVFSVVVIPPDTGWLGCPGLSRGTPENLPLVSVTNSVFSSKQANPARTTFYVGAKTLNTKNGWDIKIDKATGITPALNPNEALVVFVNSTSTTKSMYTVQNVQNCATTQRKNLILVPGATGSIRISRDYADTLVLSTPSGDIAIFNEGAFWTLFGGRRVTINWFWG